MKRTRNYRVLTLEGAKDHLRPSGMDLNEISQQGCVFFSSQVRLRGACARQDELSPGLMCC